MQNLEQVFDYIKFLPFLEQYTDINPNGGIRGRKTGKGTNKNDKQKTFTDADKTAIKEGLITLIKDVNQVIKSIE